MKKLYIQITFLLSLLVVSNLSFSQTYNDGPIRLRVWANKVWSSANCGEIGNKEYRITDVQARVSNGSGYTNSIAGLNLGWENSSSVYNNLPNASSSAPGGMGSDGNGYRLLDVTYSGTRVPSEFEVYLGAAYEEDCEGDILSCSQGTKFNKDDCCCLFGLCASSDDYYQSGPGWTDVLFRGGEEGVVNYTQPILIDAGGEHKYAVVFAYQWDMLEEKPLCASPNYQDGSIQLTADIIGFFADMNWDGTGVCGVSLGGAEDLRAKVLAKDNLQTWAAAHPSGFPTTTAGCMFFTQNEPQWNTGSLSSTFTNTHGSYTSFPVRVYNRTFNTTDQNFTTLDFAYDVWEEDSWYLSALGLAASCGSNQNYEGCDYPSGDPWYCNPLGTCVFDDDAHVYTRASASGNAAPVTGKSINWRLSPPNTDNIVEIPLRLSTGSSYNSWIMKVRYRWNLAAPSISVTSSNDLTYCIGTTAAAITTTATNATYFKWQISSETYAPASCGSVTTWTDIAGANCRNYTPAQIAGTRLYRCIAYNRGGNGSDNDVANNTSAKYDSVISTCVRITYFPYAPPVVSAVCGLSATAGTPIPFSVAVVPAVGAVANATSVLWTTSPAATISAPTAYSTDITFPGTGTYTVTFTVTDACAAANASSSCIVQVGPTTCDYIYVSPSGSNTITCGDANSPCQTLTGTNGALTKVVGTRNKIRMANGAYAETAVVSIPSNVIIDGGYSVSAGNWTKNSNSTTNITCSGTVNISADIEHVMGFSANATTGWKLIDLNITTVASSGNTSSGNGKSNYALWINGTTNYEVIRCSITSGAATNGLGRVAGPTWDGQTGGTGSVGATGGRGNSTCTALCTICQDDSRGTAGGGGAGGAGGANATRVGGTTATAGRTGGAGGTGADDDGGANDCSGTPATAGSAGSNSTGGTAGTAGSAGACDSGNNDTPYGGTGGNASGTGNAGANGSTVASAINVSGYFVPSYGTNGTAGQGGPSGGGGGGGGKDHGDCDGSGGGGSGGGGGGGGGGAGAGGRGGGSSYSVFLYNAGGASALFNSCIYATGVAGTGGAGGVGGSGGAGAGTSARSGACANGDGDCNQGGTGGSGSTGGAGGAGGAANGGERIAMRVTGTSPTQVGTAVTVNSSISGGARPSTPVVTIDYGKTRLCKNSAIPITTTAASWALPGTWAYVFNRDATTTSFTNASLSAEIYTATASTVNDLTSNAVAFPKYLTVVDDDRQTIDMTNTFKAEYCIGESINLTASVWGVVTATDHRWRLYAGTTTAGSLVWSNTTSATPTLNLNTTDIPALVPGDYILKYDQREQCCGWSLPVYRKFKVFGNMTAPTAWTSTPASGAYCTSAYATLTIDNPTGHTGGTTGISKLMYRYSSDGGASWSAWADLPGAGTTTIPKSIGNILVESAFVTPGAPAGCDTAKTPIVINWDISDTVQASAAIDELLTCGNPSQTAILSAAIPASGTGTWSVVTANGTTSSPAVPTTSNTITISNLPNPTGTATYRWTVVNGACSRQRDIVITSATLNTTVISMDTLGCYFCSIANGNTYTYYDYNGDIIMKIEDLTGGAYSTQGLASTQVCQRIVTPNFPNTPKVLTNFYLDYMPYLKRYWSITPQVNPNLPARVTLYFTATELNSLVAGAAGSAYAFALSDYATMLRISKFPGGGDGVFTGPDNIANQNNVPGGENIVTGGFAGSHPLWVSPVFSSYGSNYQAEFIIDEFSTFYIHPVRFPYEVLPVELVSFTGTNVGDKNKLDWVTASEQNTLRFEVEKSLDARNWFYIGEKPAAGNSNSTLNYTLFDNNPVIGNNYYRLKIIDNDATYSYSNVINISLKNNVTDGIINVYPNPTSDNINILISSTAARNSVLEVYDVLGKVVLSNNVTINEGLNKINLNTTSLANATYIISLTTVNGKTDKYKFVKN